MPLFSQSRANIQLSVETQKGQGFISNLRVMYEKSHAVFIAQHHRGDLDWMDAASQLVKQEIIRVPKSVAGTKFVIAY